MRNRPAQDRGDLHGEVLDSLLIDDRRQLDRLDNGCVGVTPDLVLRHAARVGRLVA
jgi:hypothetical protein